MLASLVKSMLKEHVHPGSKCISCDWLGKSGGLGGAANTPQAIAKRYASGGVPLKLENVDKFWGIKHELGR